MEWQPIETADELEEIVALSDDYHDGLVPIVLRRFKYNGLEAWRDWDGDPHEPTHWLPHRPLPMRAEAVAVHEELA